MIQFVKFSTEILIVICGVVSYVIFYTITKVSHFFLLKVNHFLLEIFQFFMILRHYPKFYYTKAIWKVWL